MAALDLFCGVCFYYSESRQLADAKQMYTCGDADHSIPAMLGWRGHGGEGEQLV